MENNEGRGLLESEESSFPAFAQSVMAREQMLVLDEDSDDLTEPPRRRLREAGGLVVLTSAAALFAFLIFSGSGHALRSVVQPDLSQGKNIELEYNSAYRLGRAPRCHDTQEGEPCYFSVTWAMTTGIFQHPEWYVGLSEESSAKEFQALLFKRKVHNCSTSKPCGYEKYISKLTKAEAAAKKAATENKHAEPSVRHAPMGPLSQTFYMYRAQSQSSYPLENINAADLAGVFWYLHNEVVVATPRKYRIDRIKRYKVTVKNTWEFWNVHKRQFGAFVAFDGGMCTTPVCKDVYPQYGYIVGCQVQDINQARYLGRKQTNWQCGAGEDACRAPIWYSLPGPCPDKGIAKGKIGANTVDLDVNKYKTPHCISREPGGHCPEASGAADCTYNYMEAGEILLDELVGIGDYDTFWNTSYSDCMRNRQLGLSDEVCRHNKEYDPDLDAGVGLHFWDGKLDEEKCTRRMNKARSLFKAKFPEFPESLQEPPCEFDMYYQHEFSWPVNHSRAVPSSWWQQSAS